MILLECKNLTKRFGGLTAIKNLSLYVDDREILGLIGPNGAGKTTLFNLISGVYYPDEGKIIFMGKEITHLKPNQRCKIGIARTYQLIKPYLNQTVLQNVLVGILFGRREKSDLNVSIKEALNILKFLNLEDKCDEHVEHLSILDRKKVEIARALAVKPRLLLLDEPMSGLNPTEVDHFSKIILQVKEKYQSTIFIIEHVLRAIMRLAQRVIVISYGEKICEGTPEHVCADKEVLRAYLGEGFVPFA